MEYERLTVLTNSLSLGTPSPRLEQRPSTRGPSGQLQTHRSSSRYHPGVSASEVPQFTKDGPGGLGDGRKTRPQLLPLADTGTLVSAQEMNRQQQERAGVMPVGHGGVTTASTVIGLSKDLSTIPVQHLNRIGLSQMPVGRASGYYVLCRVIARCTRMVGIQTVVEDPEGGARELSIYDFPTTFGCPVKYVDGIFPVGTVIGIREPTLKEPLQANSHGFLRVDSPTDIVFIPPNSTLLRGIRWSTPEPISTLPTTAEQWQQRGTDFFKASMWLPAALAFSYAIALDPARAGPLRLNRADTFYRLEYYSGAIYDAQWVFHQAGVPPTYAAKALLRLAKARYGRGEFRAAAEDFLRWKRMHVGDVSADPWVERCRARVQEETIGLYNWPYLFQSAKRKIRVDAGDFVGPVEVRRLQDRGGGRGMVASRNLKMGELLLAVKPFVSVYATDLPPNQVVVAFDLHSKSNRGPTDSLLIARIIEKVYGNPDLYDQILHLYAGPNYPPPPPTYPPPPSAPAKVDLMEPRVAIDVSRIEAVCTFNGFCPFRLDGPREDREAKPTGLYARPSMFNHSCVANAIWYCIGDLMVIRAAEPIPAGAEITIPYSVEESYFDRRKVLLKHMSESCKCRLCEDDARIDRGQLESRHKLKSKVDAAGAPSVSLSDVRALEKDISATYSSDRGPIRPCSGLALHVLAEKLRASGKQRHLREAIQCDMQALERYGFTFLHDSTGSSRGLPFTDDRIPTATSFMELAEIMLRIAHTFLMLREEANAVRWLKAALWLTDVSVGGGKELFMMIHEEPLRRMDLQAFVARAL